MSDTGTDSDSVDSKDPDAFASIWIASEMFILLLIIPVYVLDLCSKKRNRSRSAKHTKRLMLAVFLSNCFHQVTYLVMATTCENCRAEAILVVNSRLILRGINLLFLIHRAKLVQGMRPILSTKWFSTILPSIVIMWTIGGCAYYNMINEREWRCGSYVDSDTFHWCRDLGGLEFTDQEKIIRVYVALPWDLFMTVFLMVLFIVPMYRVYNTDLGIMNGTQVRQRMKLKRLLIWSVILTFINQMSSTFIWAYGFGQSPLLLILVLIGKFDPPINVWTSWLMVTRNREYLQSVCCCCCRKPEERRRVSQQSAITDLSSRNSRGPVPFSRQSTIEMSASSYRN